MGDLRTDHMVRRRQPRSSDRATALKRRPEKDPGGDGESDGAGEGRLPQRGIARENCQQLRQAAVVQERRQTDQGGQRPRHGEVEPEEQPPQPHFLALVHSSAPYRAAPPRSSSIRSSWLYLAMRSVRLAEPVLIWPALVATAMSAMLVSSVSPLRWLMIVV